MKYKNAGEILPEELVRQLQNYVQGEYIYIPKTTENRQKWGENTNHKREMILRNERIFEKYLEGESVDQIAKMFHLSPRSIRRIIGEQKKSDEKNNELIRSLVEDNWNISGQVQHIYTTAWQMETEETEVKGYVLKEYTQLVELTRNLELLKQLEENNVPVAKVIRSVDEKEYVESNHKFYLLCSELEGSNIVDVAACGDEWFYNMGKTIANLHVAFRKCQRHIECWHNSLLGEMKSWIREKLEHDNWNIISKNEYEDALTELELGYDKLPVQLIHRDVHLGNFLFDHNQFSGYLDFDLSQINIRIFDICYFLLGLLLEDTYRVEEDKWFRIVGCVVSGYNDVEKLHVIESEKICCVMKCIEILFAAWFIGEGDYEQAEAAARIFKFLRKHEQELKWKII